EGVRQRDDRAELPDVELLERLRGLPKGVQPLGHRRTPLPFQVIPCSTRTLARKGCPGSVPIDLGCRAGYVRVRTPRLRSWSAMMLRWISEVPSQIRSTRSSR